MSFLKKHWRFTVPAVTVLCVLMIGVVALYTGEPPETTTVYVMPERSGEQPRLNTSGMPLTSVPPAHTPAETAELAAEQEVDVPSDSENLESCCPEESAQVGDISALPSEGNIVHVPSEVIAEAQRYQAWNREYEEYRKREKRLEDKTEVWSREVDAVADAFYATLSPADRASVRAGLPPEARYWYPSLFDDVTPARLPDPDAQARSHSVLSKGDALLNQIKQLNTPPPAPSPHSD